MFCKLPVFGCAAVFVICSCGSSSGGAPGSGGSGVSGAAGSSSGSSDSGAAGSSLGGDESSAAGSSSQGGAAGATQVGGSTATGGTAGASGQNGVAGACSISTPACSTRTKCHCCPTARVHACVCTTSCQTDGDCSGTTCNYGFCVDRLFCASG